MNTTMKNFVTLMLCFLTLSLTAQDEYPFPYNPDVNSDGYIGINDLMELLSIYGEEFGSDQLFYSDTEAMLDLGIMYYGECVFQCSQLQGDWKVADIEGIGKFKDDLQNDIYWNDLTPNGGKLPVINKDTFSTGFTFGDNNEYYSCACLTRVQPAIEYTYCITAYGNDNNYIQTCIDQKLSDGWLPIGGMSIGSNSPALSQAFWRLAD